MNRTYTFPGDTQVHATRYVLPPDVLDDGQASWTATVSRSTRSGTTCPSSYDETGEGSGGPGGPTSPYYLGPLGLKVGWGTAQTNGTTWGGQQLGAGYIIRSDGLGSVPVTIVQSDCRGTTTTFAYNRTEPAKFFVPSPLDDQFILDGEGTDIYSPPAAYTVRTTRYRLRKVDCTGVPDTDGDGFDDCEEFDAGTDRNNETSVPAL